MSTAQQSTSRIGTRGRGPRRRPVGNLDGLSIAAHLLMATVPVALVSVFLTLVLRLLT